MSIIDKWDEDLLRTTACDIITNNPPVVCEHVSITLSNITVVIDVPEINDDTIWDALNMISTALQQLNGTQGIVKVGHCNKFKNTDLLLLDAG